MNKFFINSNYEFKGIWFLPEDKDDGPFYSGILKYDPEKNHSSLVIWNNEKKKNNKLINSKLLNGICDNKIITLTNLGFNSLQTSFYCEYQFSVYESILIGKHYETKEDIVFDEIYYRFSGLSKLCLNHKSDGDFKMAHVSIDYQKPDDIILLNNNESLHKLVHSFRTIPYGKKAEIEAEEYIKVENIKPVSLEKVLADSRIINNFIKYNLNINSHILRLSVKDGEDYVQILNQFYRKTELIENSDWMASSRFLEIEDNEFNKYYNSWFTYYSDNINILNKYFLLMESNRYFLEEEFLQKTQIFEEIHRKSECFNQIIKNETEHNHRVSAILESCPEEHNQWLADKIKYSNEISFRKRLKDLMAEMQFYFNLKLGLSNKQIKNIVSKIYGTRNYMTHGSVESEKIAENDPRSILILNNILKVLIDYIILKNLKISDELIKDAMYKKPTFYKLLYNSNRNDIDWNHLRYINNVIDT